MAKIQPDSITAHDLETFVNEQSDFTFEMQVLAQAWQLGFRCSHAGTYRDPVTDKVRQFDIRAIREENPKRLVLTIECKNIRENYPLLISAVPRTASEAFHDLIHTPQDAVRASVITQIAEHSFYRPGEMVGKRTDQVGRLTNGTLSSDDQTTFDKIGQAVNSCQDLVTEYGGVTSRWPGGSPRSFQSLLYLQGSCGRLTTTRPESSKGRRRASSAPPCFSITRGPHLFPVLAR